MGCSADDDVEGSPRILPLDEICKVLSSPQRVHSLTILEEPDGSGPLNGLVEAPCAATSEERRAQREEYIQFALDHVHVPRLFGVGAVQFHEANSVVELPVDLAPISSAVNYA